MTDDERIGLYTLVQYKENRQLLKLVVVASEEGLAVLLKEGSESRPCWIEALHEYATLKIEQRR
jgi:hypothetical protein